MARIERLAVIEGGRPGRAAYADIDERLQLAFEQRLLGPMAEIADRISLLECQVDDAQAEQFRAVKSTAARQCVALRDMLAFLQTAMLGEARVSRRPVDLRLLCERVLDAIHGRYPERSTALMSRTRVDGEWDPDLVADLLTHLVVNAFEHGTEGKTVRISLRAVEDRAVIEVQSAGRLDEEVGDRLFEPFNRGLWARAEKTGGLGMGLGLANEIARAHGGWIEAWSDRSRGTTFRVTLPRA